MKHRIVLKNNKFYVQTKGFFGWDFERDGYAGLEIYFDKQQSAEEYVESQIRKNNDYIVIKTY